MDEKNYQYDQYGGVGGKQVWLNKLNRMDKPHRMVQRMDKPNRLVQRMNKTNSMV